jgi:hypothetical protein
VNAAFAFRSPIETVIIPKPKILISTPIFGGDDVTGIDVSNSKDFLCGQGSLTSVSFVSVKRNPAVRRQIDLCPAVKDIIKAGIVAAQGYSTHIADGNSKSTAESDHRIRIFRTGGCPSLEDGWSRIPAANRLEIVAQVLSQIFIDVADDPVRIFFFSSNLLSKLLDVRVIDAVFIAVLREFFPYISRNVS